MKLNPTIPAMIAEAKVTRRFRRDNLPASLVFVMDVAIFILVFLVCSLLLESFTFLIFFFAVILMNEELMGMFAAASQDGQDGINLDVLGEIANKALSIPEMHAAMLLGTVGTIIGVLIFCRYIEGRKLATLGFRRRNMAREYLLGLLIGTSMFSLAVFSAFMLGTMTYSGMTGVSVVLLMLFFFGFVVQGMSEEVLCRGYFMVTLARRQKVAFAVVVSSCVFGFLHLLNNNLVVLGMINIMLFGAFMGIYMLKRGDIWGIAAIHTSWNFVQGNVFGISVSGLPLQPSVFVFEPIAGAELINGGAFGLEAGLAATIVLVAALLLTTFMKCKDPAPSVRIASDGFSQEIIVPGTHPLPIAPIPKQYWQPPAEQAPRVDLPPPPPPVLPSRK